MSTNSNEDGQGVVFRKTLGHYTVRANGREIDCALSSLIRKQLIYPIADPTSLRHRVREVREVEHIDPVAIGDRVRFEEVEGRVIDITLSYTYVDPGDESTIVILPCRSPRASRYVVTKSS